MSHKVLTLNELFYKVKTAGGNLPFVNLFFYGERLSGAILE